MDHGKGIDVMACMAKHVIEWAMSQCIIDMCYQWVVTEFGDHSSPLIDKQQMN